MSSEFLERHAVTSFRGRALPGPAWPVGYARLIDRYDLQVPLPRQLTAVSVRYRKAETYDWLLLGSRSEIPDELGAHLTLALKREGVDLSVLAALFRALDVRSLTEFIVAQPTSAYGRRIWFLYEWLTGSPLPIPDLDKASAVDAVDPKVQFALADGELSSRHKVRNNLPGTPEFCPLVRRTEALTRVTPEALANEAAEVVGRTRPDIVQRAGAFLLLADSRASFEIEGERPSADRLQRWGYAIRDAGRTALSIDELLRLQRLVVGDTRFIRLGLRVDGGFVGLHDRRTRAPIPEHISARPEDLPRLTRGVVDYLERAIDGGADPIAIAAASSFGFVYIHPFEDGNGRLHRWLLHHALAVGEITSANVVFPVSHVILRRLSEYRAVLESHSRLLLPLIEWEETGDHNVRVTNRTIDYYRYFDATRHAEFVHSCIREAIEKDLPEEVRYLEAFDAFSAGVQRVVELPQRDIDLLATFMRQGGGVLSKRARTKEFAALEGHEVEEIEALYRKAFGGGG